MSKLQDIRELAQEHATSVSSSPRDWMGYMDTAARLYRYPFTDQLTDPRTASTGNRLCVPGTVE